MQSLYLPPGKAIIGVLVAVAGCTVCLVLTPPERWFAGCFLSIMLAWAALIDIDRMILPDLLTFPLLLAGLANAASRPQPGLVDAAAGAAVGYLVFTGLSHAFSNILGRSALGKGDAKLFAASGAWLGWEWLPYITLISSSCALLMAASISAIRRRSNAGTRIAFGPYIALGALICWLRLHSQSSCLAW